MNAAVALTAFWLRSRATRRAAVILVAVFTVITAVSLSVAALTLTAAQQQAQDFGRYQQASYLSMQLGDLRPGTTARLRTAVSKEAFGAAVWVTSTTLRPDSYTKYFFQAPITSLQYLENAGSRPANPDRYLLGSGRWPTAARDVLVSSHLLAQLPDKQSFTVLSGHARMRIVGVVTDRFATDDDVILAAAGTWESLTPLPVSRQYQPIDGQIQLLWNRPATIEQITAAVTVNLPKRLLNSGAVEALTADLSHRTDLRSTNEAAARIGAVSPVPLLLVVLLVAVLAAATSRNANRTAGTTLTALGVRRRTVTSTQALAALVTAAAAAALGLTLGWIITAGIRALVLTRVAAQPLAPSVPPGRYLLLIAVAGVVVVAGATLLPARASRAVVPRSASRRRALISRASRWLLAGGAIVAGATQGGQVAPYLLLIGLLLLGPDLLHLVRALLPRTRPRGLVTRGLMSAAAAQQAAAVVVIGACVAVPLLVAAQIASRQASDATFTFSSVPAGQIWVERFGDTADLRGVARAIATIPGFPAPVAVRDLAAAPNADGSAGARAQFTSTTTGGIALLVIPSSEALHRLFGDALPASAGSTLDQGGVLDFLTERGNRRLAVYADGGRLQTTTGPLPTQHVRIDRAWRAQFGGAILTRTAHALQLPVSAPVKYLYPDVTQAQTQQAVAATVRAGYDGDFVHYFVQPPAPVLSATVSVFFAALALGGFTVLLLTTTEQTRRLRSYSSRLIAIGLGPRWTRSLLALQTAVITTAGLATGLIAGIAAVHHATRDYPITVVPLLPAAATSAFIVLATLIITVLSARNLSARTASR